jgi:hypothetical protein
MIDISPERQEGNSSLELNGSSANRKSEGARLPYPRDWEAVRHLAAQIDWRSILAFCLPFFLYLATLAPTVYNLDSAELTTAAATGGIVRATGYPFYLTIGHFWAKLPLGDVGFRLNLFSAFSAALTVMLADRILRRWQVGPVAALGALGLLATGTYFWGLSLIAEVYTLHTALMAAFILALLRWGERPSPGRLAAAGLIAGISLSHHMATVLLIPGGLFYLLCTAPRKVFAPRALLGGLLGLFAGLSFYLYIPLRYLAEPAFNYAGVYGADLVFNKINLLTLDGFFWLVSGQAFSNQMLAYEGAALWGEIRHFGVLLSQAFFAFGIAPGLVGMVVLFKRSWRQASMLLLMFLFSAGFYIQYRVLDKDTMFLPAFLIWALWVGIGYQAIFSVLMAALEDGRWRRVTLLFVQAGAVLAVLAALAWNWSITDLSSDRSTRERGEEILASARPNALIFGWWDTVPVIQYLQLVEGQRPDITAINRFLIPSTDLVLAIQHQIGERPVYIDSVTSELSSFALPRSRGPVYELAPKNQTSGGKK